MKAAGAWVGEHAGLCRVVSCAAVIYLWFVLSGPRRTLTQDELNFIYESLRLPAEGRIMGYGHGPLLYEILAVLQVIQFMVLRGLGMVSVPQDFLVFILQHVILQVSLCRIITAISGLATLVMVYRVGDIFGGRRVGLLAAILCASNLMFYVMTCLCKEDPLFWALSLLAMECAWRTQERRSIRLAILGGLSIAAAFSAKYLGLFLPVLIVVPLVRSSKGGLSEGVRLSAAMGVSALTGLVIFFPFLITDTAAVLASMRETDSLNAAMGTNWAMAAYVRHHLPNLMGFPVLIAATIEAVRQLRSAPRGPIILFAPAALLLAAVGLRSGFSMAHYVYLLALCGFILAASLANALATKAASSGMARVALSAIPLIVFIHPAYLSGATKYMLLLTGPQTSESAYQFIRDNARPGDCVAMNQGSAGDNIFGPRLAASNPPAGAGAFGKARAKAALEMTGPKYAVHIGNFGEMPADFPGNCQWLVLGSRGGLPRIEIPNQATIPPLHVPLSEYERRFSVKAFPEEHSSYYPHLTTSDFEELRNATLFEIWRHRRMGLNFEVFSRKPGSG